MPPRKSNVSQTNAPGEDGTPVKEREGINIEVGRYLPLRPYFYFFLYLSPVTSDKPVAEFSPPSLPTLFLGSCPPATSKTTANDRPGPLPPPHYGPTPR